jgi:hypothetical protein
MRLQIGDDQLASFLACLGLGTLYAIRDGAIPARTGIWTLAPPRTWRALEENPSVPAEIVAVFQHFDELDVLQRHYPQGFDLLCAELIARLEAVLSEIEDPVYVLKWIKGRKSSLPK